MIADLFNACANSPHPEYALRKARSLRLSLDRENFKMCKVAYNNMIRAFGRGGDLESAFSAMDDMKRNQIFMGSDTYAALLQG